MNPIQRLAELGQSVWLDFIDSSLLRGGELERRIRQDGLRGLTSNPTIFQKAIASSNDYDDLIQRASAPDTNEAILERLMVRDLELACDLFRPLYDSSHGVDGLASIEIAPSLARDTAGSIETARRLWNQVERPNLMVKIPGTRDGLPAIEQSLTAGINVNVTLLFSVSRYLEVVEAYFRALEARIAANEPIDRIASVASFFVSRVDAKVDKALDALPSSSEAQGKALRGRIAIANAKIAYEAFEHAYSGERWKRLAAYGARPQRLLWGSTSPKDPHYPDTYYAEALVGAQTVDTMTPECFEAYLDHGDPEPRLEQERAEAHQQLARLKTLGIDLDEVTRTLEDEGVDAFAESFDKAVKSIATKRRQDKAA
ncbi:transaldolase [Chondromyces crocatus]